MMFGSLVRNWIIVSSGCSPWHVSTNSRRWRRQEEVGFGLNRARTCRETSNEGSRNLAQFRLQRRELRPPPDLQLQALRRRTRGTPNEGKTYEPLKLKHY